jgi:hypothetical protein
MIEAVVADKAELTGSGTTLRSGLRYVNLFLDEIEDRVSRQELDMRDALMLIHAFDHFVDAGGSC